MVQRRCLPMQLKLVDEALRDESDAFVQSEPLSGAAQGDGPVAGLAECLVDEQATDAAALMGLGNDGQSEGARYVVQIEECVVSLPYTIAVAFKKSRWVIAGQMNSVRTHCRVFSLSEHYF